MRNFLPQILVSASLVLSSVWLSAKTTEERELEKEIDLAISEIPAPRRQYETNTQIKQKKKVVRRSQTRKRFSSRSETSRPVAKNMIEPTLPSQVPTYRPSTVVHPSGITNTYSEKSLHPSEGQTSKYGFNIYSYYSGGEKIKSTNNSANNQNVFGVYQYVPADSYESSTTLGVGLEHSLIFDSMGPIGLGYQIGATYEFDRQIKKPISQYTYYSTSNSENPSLSLALPYVNFLTSYRMTYLFGGVNYSVPMAKSTGDEGYNGRVGYQAGLGMNLGSWIAIEALYRWVSFDVTPDPQNLDYYNYATVTNTQTTGLGVISDETLDLNGFNVTLKVRF